MVATPPAPNVEWLEEETLRCAADPNRFNEVALARPPYWARQRELSASVRKYRTTVAVTGNGVGKSYHAAGIALWFGVSHPGCRVVIAAPTLGQLTNVVWAEIEAAHRSADREGFPLGGKMRSLSYDLGDDWKMEGYGSGSVESKSGRHAADLLAIVDEASGVPSPVMEAINSLNPSKIVLYGNPLRPEGNFYELAELSGENPRVNVIRIPSLESPDIDQERSSRGMADRTWLEDARHTYGEDSAWWAAHVLARFPNEITEALLPIPWLTLASQTPHVPRGDRWIGVDLAEGNEGDDCVIVVRDDGGVIECEASNRWGLETTADRVRALSDAHGVEPSRVVYDSTGTGTDFDSRLRTVGIAGAKGYKGARSGGDKFANLRSASAWRFRQRLDPKRTTRTQSGPGKPALWVPQPPFSLRAELLNRYRAELQGVSYRLLPDDEIALEAKDEFVKRLKKSPNFLDAIFMTFAYPFA